MMMPTITHALTALRRPAGRRRRSMNSQGGCLSLNPFPFALPFAFIHSFAHTRSRPKTDSAIEVSVSEHIRAL